MTNYLTKEGLTELSAELKSITEIKLPDTLESINKALAEGDVRENSGLDAAKIERDKLVARQQEIEEILSNYEIIDEKNAHSSKSVKIGSSVKIQYLSDDSVYELRIVGNSEADIIENKISNESPLAQAILGKTAGQESSFKSRSGNIKVKVLEIF